MKPEKELNKPETEGIELTNEELDAVAGGIERQDNDACPKGGTHQWARSGTTAKCSKCGAEKKIMARRMY